LSYERSGYEHRQKGAWYGKPGKLDLSKLAPVLGSRKNGTLKRHNEGVIHGRFQVLHNDHLKYLLAGKAMCRHLVVGITNPDPAQVKNESADPHRSVPEANPLTYYERYHLVRAALTEAGLSLNEFSVVPFPINSPENYRYYVPMDAVFFLTIYDDWGRQKKIYFESLSLNVHVLWEVKPDEKGISGSDVRSKMVDDLPWEHLVPGAVAALLKEWKISERLRKIKYLGGGVFF
jgi:nicotinamide-nucleotide adenylyltransferase